MLSSIKRDLVFFRKHNIIDYSLIVSVVDKSKLPAQYLYTEKQNGNYRLLESEEDPNIAYFIGIIDYFQLYTIKKRLERLYKRIKRCNSNLETSSQPPQRYATRFERKITQYFYEIKDTRSATMKDLGSPTRLRPSMSAQQDSIIFENKQSQGSIQEINALFLKCFKTEEQKIPENEDSHICHKQNPTLEIKTKEI